MKSRHPVGLATLVAVATLSLTSCSSAPKKLAEKSAEARKEVTARPLTHEESSARFRQVAHVTYGLWFGLDAESPDFEGRATINFDLKPKAKDHGKDIFLDFYDGNIRSILLNGMTLSNPGDRYDGNRIHFSLSELQAGSNRIEIAYTHKYSTNGHGLYKFKDPEDGAVYLYTDDEPYFAHTFFPCFDQPDLKAPFELTVATPEDWQVVTNTLERDTSKVDGKKVWVFPPSPLLSTYLFALIAGDYTSWKADANGIPMRLFARKTLKKYVDAAEWFDITRRGLDFYSVQFGYPYPYSKFDEILVPDFDEGAMENAGAITFTERYVFRTKVPRRTHMHRANTILHEMAHQWFGDLVTMKWWNGLWLNESFADFMAAWAVDEATGFKGSWQDFFSDDKGWAYWQDQLSTTHPIELPVVDTDHAFSNFDGITYGKGASVIKQLRFYLGDDDFREGLQRYFQRYALRNSTLGEFMKVLAEASGKDLSRWQELWLKTPGVNTVRADWACDDTRKVSKFDLLQGNAPESKTLRPHRAELGLFQETAGKYAVKDPTPAEFSKDTTSVAEAIGKPCPAFVYPNLNDHDYVKVLLDPVSQKKMIEVLPHIADPLVREMVWAALWDEIVDGKLPAETYLETALKVLHGEKDPLVLAQVLSSLIQLNPGRESALKFVDSKDRPHLWDALEAMERKSLASAESGSDLQLVWFNSFLESVHTDGGVRYVRELLEKKAKIPGIKIDQDVRWSLIIALAWNGADHAQELIDTEYKADATHFGKTRRLQALVEIPSSKSKQEWFGKIADAVKTGGSTPELSSANFRTVMEHLSMLGQESFTEEWLQRYFDLLPAAAHSSDEEFAENYARSLFPAICTQKVVDLTSAALHQDLPAAVEKSLKTHLQEEERCLRARAAK